MKSAFSRSVSSSRSTVRRCSSYRPAFSMASPAFVASSSNASSRCGAIDRSPSVPPTSTAAIQPPTQTGLPIRTAGPSGTPSGSPSTTTVSPCATTRSITSSAGSVDTAPSSSKRPRLPTTWDTEPSSWSATNAASPNARPPTASRVTSTTWLRSRVRVGDGPRVQEPHPRRLEQPRPWQGGDGHASDGGDAQHDGEPDAVEGGPLETEVGHGEGGHGQTRGPTPTRTWRKRKGTAGIRWRLTTQLSADRGRRRSPCARGHPSRSRATDGDRRFRTAGSG